jgi:dTMP kinase
MAGTGMLVVFEGIEGSGKTTQANLLYESISRLTERCVLTVEPRPESPITRLIREELKKDPSKEGEAFDMRALQLLFAADRSVHVEKLIRPSLEAGEIVVVDRYFLTSVAYSSAFGNEELADYFMSVNSVFPKPDLLFYLRVAPEVALRRVALREKKDRYDNLESLRKQYDAYQSLAQRHRSEAGSRWCEIDGDRDQQSVAADVLAAWKERSATNLGRN